MPLLAFVPALAVAGVLGLGGWMVVDGRITLGDFVRFNLLLGDADPAAAGARHVGRAGPARRRQRRRACSSCSTWSPSWPTRRDPKPLPADGGGAIRFEGVRFGYDQDRPIVCDVDLDIPAGSTVALIGPTGCGKTTLTTLVPRFYDVTAGRVLVDGIDVRELSLVDLRRNIGVVTEDTFLFSAPRAREHRVRRAVGDRRRRARRRPTGRRRPSSSSRCPTATTTQIGERGLTLSGGQRQRIAIARALLVNPRILILDDATAAVDATTEAKIKRALQELMRDRTTIIIAHRLVHHLAGRARRRDGPGPHRRRRRRTSELARTSELYSRIRTHGLLDRTFVDLDGDRVRAAQGGRDRRPAARERGSRLG